MSFGIYDELRDFLIEPTSDKSGIHEKPINYGEDILSFCPIHELGGDHKRRSLKLSTTGIGLHCYAGCTAGPGFNNVVEALYRRAGKEPHSNREQSNVTPLKREPERAQRYPDENLVSLYKYRVLNGKEWTVVGEKGRFEFPVPGEEKPSKVFGWRIPGGTWSGGLRAGGLALSDMPLYDLKTLADARYKNGGEVWITEGEAAMVALVTRGKVALCPPGGASTKDFGTAFDVLKDHDVIIWPDNDEPGREFAQSVHRAVKSAGARSVRVHIPSIALPPKGDAVEYFQLGGTVESLDMAVLTEPVAEIVAGDAAVVHYPSDVGVFHWELKNVAVANRSTEGRLSIWLENPSFRSKRPYTQRINIDSASAVDTLRRTLEMYFADAGGKSLRIVEMINTVFSMLRETLAKAEKILDAADLVFDEEQDIEIAGPLAVGDGHTIWFGDGGTAKSFVAYALAVAMGYNLPFAGQRVKPGKVLVVDWEGSKSSFARRLYRILRGYGLERHTYGKVSYLNAHGLPLGELIDELRERIAELDIRFIIIDSIGPACGGEPEKADIAIQYFQQLHRLGVPTLSIAHVTKDGEDSKPFGSTFFSNMARRTFFMMAAANSTYTDKFLTFYCRKVNDGTFPAPIGIQVHFDDSSNIGPVTMRPDFAEVEGRARRALQYQIQDILDAPLTLEEILEELNMKKSPSNRAEVYNTLRQFSVGANALFYTKAHVEDNIEITMWGRSEPAVGSEAAATGTYGDEESDAEFLPDEPTVGDDPFPGGSNVWD